MAAVTPIVEGFSVSHAAILDGTTGAETSDIYGIQEGALAVDTSDFDNTGDNTTLSSWSWINFATLTVKSGFVPLDLLSTLTGATLTSSGSGATVSYTMPLWNEKSMSQPTRPVLLRIPSRDTAGNSRTFDIVLYKVQFAPFALEGITYKNGLILTYSGKALLSSVDEKGGALTDRAVGRLVSSQAL